MTQEQRAGERENLLKGIEGIKNEAAWPANHMEISHHKEAGSGAQVHHDAGAFGFQARGYGQDQWPNTKSSGLSGKTECVQRHGSLHSEL